MNIAKISMPCDGKKYKLKLTNSIATDSTRETML